jgi:hypothetical protein
MKALEAERLPARQLSLAGSCAPHKTTGYPDMEKTVEHRCLPRTAQPCQRCGETLPVAVYCDTCGADISPEHHCPPRALPHVCPPSPPPGRCLACGQEQPRARYCKTCGHDITPSHHCPAAPPTQMRRADPVHVCPAYKIERCRQCGQLMPALAFCEHCGADITPQHVCYPAPAAHVCPPVVTMPRRCSHCGEMLPRPRHCSQCGADITPAHVCAGQK